MPVFSILALIAYLLSLGLIIPSLVRKSNAYRRLALVSAVVALFCHGIALKHQIFDVGDGQNLTLLNIGSIVGLMICSIMTFVASRGRGWFLLPIVYSFAMINLAFASLMPGEFITHLEGSPALFIHIGLALLGYATLIIAALYALQLAWLDYLLKNKKLTFTADMPPLMSIERKMFHITQIGVVLLTLTLCTGLLYMDNLFSKEISIKPSCRSWLGLSTLFYCGATIMKAGVDAVSFGSALLAHFCSLWLILAAACCKKSWFTSNRQRGSCCPDRNLHLSL